MSEKIVAQARFDQKLPLYLYLRSLGTLAVTVIGIPLLPIWVFAGWWWSKRYYATLRCNLTDRHLRISRGVVFRQDKTIPLEKIQDLSLRHGPVLRALGISALRVETAGQSSAQGQSDAEFIGIIDVQEFQELVLAQRDRLESRTLLEPPSSTLDEDLSTKEVLLEIRDTLKHIEKHLRHEQEIKR